MLFTVPMGRSFFGWGTGIEFGLVGCLKMWWLPVTRFSTHPAASSSRINSLLCTSASLRRSRRQNHNPRVIFFKKKDTPSVIFSTDHPAMAFLSDVSRHRSRQPVQPPPPTPQGVSGGWKLGQCRAPGQPEPSVPRQWTTLTGRRGLDP